MHVTLSCLLSIVQLTGQWRRFHHPLPPLIAGRSSLKRKRKLRIIYHGRGSPDKNERLGHTRNRCWSGSCGSVPLFQVGDDWRCTPGVKEFGVLWLIMLSLIVFCSGKFQESETFCVAVIDWFVCSRLVLYWSIGFWNSIYTIFKPIPLESDMNIVLVVVFQRSVCLFILFKITKLLRSPCLPNNTHLVHLGSQWSKTIITLLSCRCPVTCYEELTNKYPKRDIIIYLLRNSKFQVLA